MPKRSPFITVTQLSRRWHASVREIRRLADAGELPGTIKRASKCRVTYLIPQSAVSAYESLHMIKPTVPVPQVSSSKHFRF